MGFETLLYIYFMFTRKSYVFLMWDLKSISIYTLYSQEKSYFFNVGFEALLYIYIYYMFTRKKLCSFNVG
jgi:hypothetical protein